MMADKTDKGMTIFAQVFALTLVGWFACSWWYGTGTFEKTRQALPVVQAEAGCEHWRARRTENLALATEMVSPSEIPKDYCPRPK